MKTKILWQASESQKNKSNLFKYEKFLSSKFKFKVKQNYKNLLSWSINNPKNFWSSIWDFTKVRGIKTKKYERSNIFYKNKQQQKLTNIIVSVFTQSFKFNN